MNGLNELNKFLSYIHMGNETFRLYYEKACELNNKELKTLICNIQETFKKHEEIVTSVLEKNGYECSDDVTLIGKMALLIEELKLVNDSFCICERAIKSVNMGLLSGLKMLYYNKNIDCEIISVMKDVISDYTDIMEKINDYILKRCECNTCC